MRWEEAVKVALCYGWIDSTVRSLGDGKRKQYFCPRKPKSTWSRVNKNYITELKADGLMHKSGLEVIEVAKKNGSWTELDDVENGVIPEDLQKLLTITRPPMKTSKILPKAKKKLSLLVKTSQAGRDPKKNQRNCIPFRKNIKYRNQ